MKFFFPTGHTSNPVGTLYLFQKDPYMPLSKLDMVAWLVKPNGETPENPGAQQGPETPPQQDNSEVRRSARLNQ